MKYKRVILSYDLFCENYDDTYMCRDLLPTSNMICKGWPCTIILPGGAEGLEIKQAIKNNDASWAIQNIQSVSIYKKVAAKYIMDNNK
jgi:hypothetical protein